MQLQMLNANKNFNNNTANNNNINNNIFFKTILLISIIGKNKILTA